MSAAAVLIDFLKSQDSGDLLLQSDTLKLSPSFKLEVQE